MSLTSCMLTGSKILSKDTVLDSQFLHTASSRTEVILL